MKWYLILLNIQELATIIRKWRLLYSEYIDIKNGNETIQIEMMSHI